MTICLRCGWCCVNKGFPNGNIIETKVVNGQTSIISHVIAIVKPEAVAEDIDLNDKNVWMLKPLGECPHLSWTAHGNALCKIHHYSWYTKTPCHDYQGGEGPNGVCQRGFKSAKDGTSFQSKEQL